MKKRTVKLIALATAAIIALSGCGKSGGSSGGGSSEAGITDLYTYETSNRELENFVPQHSERTEDSNVLANAYSSLLCLDSNTELQPDIAEKWGTDDEGLTWTFNLRKDAKWVDMNGEEKADCNAQDWITGLEWVLNFHKNEAFNTSMPTALIEGAQEYYDYTKELSKEEALALGTDKFLEMVGIEAPDDYTLIYHCINKCPYFDTLAVCACLYPLSQSLIDEVGVESVAGLDNTKIWYNGLYTITEFIQGNTKVLTKNDAYWDKEAGRFDTVTIKIVEDTTVGYQLYENGELDHITLSEANLRTIYDDENNKFHNNLVETQPKKNSYQMHLNYDKHLSDGSVDTNWNTAISNENFRLAMYYGLDFTNYWARTNYIYPTHCENLAYTMKGFLHYSDGTDYTEKVIEKLGFEPDGETSARFDADKAAEYKEKAMEELKAEGVTFPVQVDYFIVSGAQNALDSANVLKQTFEESLGSDFVQFNINTYVSSQTQEVVAPKLQSFVINGWGADYGDIQNFLAQETYGEDGAFYSNNYSNVNDSADADLIATYKEYTELVNKADEITDDMDARYDAFSDAEVYLLEHALTIPVSYEIAWQLTKINDYTKINSMYGTQNYVYRDWTTSTEAYTTEDYEKFAKEAGK